MEYDTQKSDLELVNFNSQFEHYAKENNTFFDIVTVSNLAYDVNKKNGYDVQNSVEIKIMNTNTGRTKFSILLDKNLKRNYFFDEEDKAKEQLYMYSDLVAEYTKTKDNSTDYKWLFDCTNTSYHDVTGKVNGMTFKIKENR